MDNSPPVTTAIDDTPESLQPEPELYVRVVHPPQPAGTAAQRLREGETLAVGRDVGERGLRVDDSRMSRLHFQIAWDRRQQAPRLGDARSSNGTFLNGRQVTTHILNAGDVIRAGGSLFVVDDVTRSSTLKAQIDRVAASRLTVLLIGETGTGKELSARRVHEASGRTGPFVPVNCAAIPRDLMAAEFFGHTKGAFSGAGNARSGLFLAAHGGTLFLDEIGELASDLQPTLLRALQERRVRPLGSERETEVDVRLVAATNRPQAELAGGNAFRSDLYARLAQMVVHLPPLRERRSEVLDLAYELAAQAGGELTLTTNAAEALLTWSWPHNVRELKSLVDTYVALHQGSPLSLRLLHELRPELTTGVAERQRRSTAPPGEPDPGERHPPIDRQRLEQLLARHGGNVSAVADELGAHRTQVYRWLDRFGIERGRR